MGNATFLQSYAQEYERGQKAIAENERLREENDEFGRAIACAADLMNTWARECGVSECSDPWSGQLLRDLADRLWLRSMAKKSE